MAREYTVRRSWRRTMSLEITDDLAVLVRAPFFAADRDIKQFVESHGKWIDRQTQKRGTRQSFEPDPTQRDFLLAQARAIIPQRVAYYAALMGLKPAGVKITSARKRFGSCNTKKSLCFSWRLMMYPDEAVDYVVVHELAHILQMNHSKHFYAVVCAQMPDYRKRMALLKLPPDFQYAERRG